MMEEKRLERMEESRTFRTKKLSMWFNAIFYLGMTTLSIALILMDKAVLGLILFSVFAVIGFLSRHDFSQQVTIDEMGICYKRFLDRERTLYWSRVSGIQLRGHWLELLGDPKSVRIWIGNNLENKDGLILLLAEYLPHLITKTPPPILDDLVPPTKLPLTVRPRIAYLVVLVLFAVPFGLLFVGMGGLTASGIFHIEGLGALLGVLLMTFGFLALGVLTLIWVLHEVTQKVTLDDEGVLLESWWRGGYLQWSQVQDATVNGFGWDIRLRGNGKSLSFVFRWVPKEQKDDFTQALQYYLTKHQIPLERRDWLLP